MRQGMCKRTRDQLADLVTGSLPGEPAAHVRRHLDSCPACKAYFEALCSDDDLLAGFAHEMEAVVTRVERDVMRQLAQTTPAQATPTVRTWSRLANRWFMKVAAAAVLVLGGLLLFGRSEKALYADVIKALARARTLHVVSMSLRDGRWEKGAEIWYEQDAGVAETAWQSGEMTFKRIDDGQYMWIHSAGSDLAQRTGSMGTLTVVADLLETNIFKENSVPLREEDKIVDGVQWQAHLQANETDTLRIVVWLDQAKRVRAWEKRRLTGDGLWEVYRRGRVEYDVVLDRGIFRADFGANVEIVEVDALLDDYFGLDQALFSTNVLGFTFAVHEVKRCEGNMPYVVCSLRPTDETKGQIEYKGPAVWNYGSFDLGSSWRQLDPNSGDGQYYERLELAHIYHNGLEVRSTLLVPLGAWPDEVGECQLEAYVSTLDSERRRHREAEGLESEANFKPIATVPLPEGEIAFTRILDDVFVAAGSLESFVAFDRLATKAMPFTDEEMDAYVREHSDSGEAQAYRSGDSIKRLYHGTSIAPSEIDKEAWKEDRMSCLYALLGGADRDGQGVERNHAEQTVSTEVEEDDLTMTSEPEATSMEPNDTPADASESVAGLTGWVRDEQGLPIADATVALYHNRNHWGLGNRVVECVQTDPNGRFLFDVAPMFEVMTQRASLQDSYVLLATHPDRALGWQHIRQGQEKQAYEITLTEPASRTITVTDHNDLPLPGARVWLSDVGDRKSSNPLFRDDLSLPTDTGLVGGTAGPDGRAVIGNLPATSCCFAATLAGHADGWAFSSQSHIRLSPGATVSGWVLTEAGDPVGKAVVRLYTQWYLHQYFLAETDGEGHFELRDLPASGWDMSPFGRSDGGSGHYKLTVEHEDYAGLPRELHLSPGETIDDLVIEVAVETTLVRCLLLEAGTDMPVAGARIDGTNEIGSIEGESDANGVFTVRVLPGPVTLSFQSPPDGVYTLDESSTEGRRIEFDAQGREMDVTLRSPVIAGPLITASGAVCGPDGLPLEGAVVYADAGKFNTATAFGYVPPTGTDVNGRFTLKGVPAGLDLHVYAETKDHVLASMAVYPAPADANELISMELVLLPTEAAIALIEHEEDHPASSLTLTIAPMVEGARIWRAERTGRTDETGLLQIDGIVPGLTYFLRDARFDRVGPRPKDRSEWFQGKEMVLIPLEP